MILNGHLEYLMLTCIWADVSTIRLPQWITVP